MNNLSIENAKLIFRNFAGKPTKFTAAGVRDFCVVIPNNIAQDLIADGWNVKCRKGETPDMDSYILNVKVSYNLRAPKIVMMTSTTKTSLDESSIGVLDYAEIDHADVIISPYNWELNGHSGVKAYLKALYVTLEEDEFEKKYSDIPESFVEEEKLPF